VCEIGRIYGQREISSILLHGSRFIYAKGQEIIAAGSAGTRNDKN
jgi:hypothetical protein